MNPSKKLGVAIVAAIALMALALPTASQASDNDPIVFVHGFTGKSEGWDGFKARLMADGYEASELVAIDYGPYDSNVATAGKVKAAVDALKASTGKNKVDLVTHSMGGLSGRHYLKHMGGTASVDEFVSIGGPNHGTTWAPVCVPIYPVPCAQMIPASPFLINLNLGDETPGSVRYLTQSSICDVIVVPSPATTPLIGATNKLVGCLDHSSMHKQTIVQDQVVDFLD